MQPQFLHYRYFIVYLLTTQRNAAGRYLCGDIRRLLMTVFDVLLSAFMAYLVTLAMYSAIDDDRHYSFRDDDLSVRYSVRTISTGDILLFMEGDCCCFGHLNAAADVAVLYLLRTSFGGAFRCGGRRYYA
jgi:hypothetical protein